MTATLTTLFIYAYSSFAAPWGAGPAISKEFEKTCHCHVKLIDVGDGGTFLSRLKIEGKATKADIVLGVDDHTLSLVKDDLHWDVKPQAFDKGPLAFIYNSETLKTPPTSLDDLLETRFRGKILLEDPRLSTTGLGFLLWVIKDKGPQDAWTYLEKLKGQIKVVSPSWDLAYGLFKKGQGDLVMSYWTSPAYHIQEEKIRKYKAAPFARGHYVHTEFAFAVPGERNADLKKQFLEFLLGDFAQKQIPRFNFMFPVKKGVALPPAFEELGSVKELDSLSPTSKDLEAWLSQWRHLFL